MRTRIGSLYRDVKMPRSRFNPDWAVLAQRAITARNQLPVVRNVRPAALFRAVRWALPRGHRPYPTRAGRLFFDVSEAPTMLMRVLRMYEPEKHRALEQVLRPGMTFVDIGACKGDFTIFAAGKLGASGRVIAVEPEPTNASWLRRSIERNGMHNVDVREMAMSDVSGRATLHRADVNAGVQVSSGWHSLAAEPPGQRDDIDIETQTLDELLTHLDITQVDVLKIDVEGWELAVLRGAAETLSDQANPPIIMMDLHPKLGVDPRAVAELLRGHGYEIFSMASPADVLDVRSDTSEIIARPRSAAGIGVA